MKPLRQTPINAAEISDSLARRDDFAFEMAVYSILRKESHWGHGLAASHSGTYRDRLTRKARQYDIKASIKRPGEVLRLAIECKQLSPAFPLVISRVPRAREDSSHNLIVSCPRELKHQYKDRPNFYTASTWGSFYTPESPVGKGITQIGVSEKLAKDGRAEYIFGDSEVYEKWSQAIASAETMVWQGINDYDRRQKGQEKTAYSAVLPILVIPDDCLWIQDYDNVGALTGIPASVSSCEYYLGHVFRRKSPKAAFYLSHLHIFTKGGFEHFILDKAGLMERWQRLFPGEVACNPMEWDDE